MTSRPRRGCYDTRTLSHRILLLSTSVSRKKTTFLRLSTLPLLLVTLMDRIFSVLPDHNKLKLAQNKTTNAKILSGMRVKFTRVWLDNAVLNDVRTALFDIVMMIYL